MDAFAVFEMPHLTALIAFPLHIQNGCWKRNHAADITQNSRIMFACFRLKKFQSI
jgi:hypothetical protein